MPGKIDRVPRTRSPTPPKSPSKQMNKIRIRYAFLLKASLALIVLGGVMFVVHRFQISRQTAGLVTRARTAVEEEDYVTATRYFAQYIAVTKQDTEIRQELAKLYAKEGVPARAFFYLEEALRIDPGLVEARKELVDAAMKIGRLADAKMHLRDHLIPGDSENAELHWQMGLCEDATGDYAAASKYFSKAFELVPTEPKYAASIADLLVERFSKIAEALAILDRLVELAPEDPMAFVARGEWCLLQRNKLSKSSKVIRDEYLDTAWQDAQTALGLAPVDPIVANLFANTAVIKKEYAKARDVLRAALDEKPENSVLRARLYSKLSEVEYTDQKLEVAIKVLKEGLEAIPGNPELLLQITQLNLDAGNTTDVETLVAELRSRDFPEAITQYLDARVKVSKGEWSRAIELIEGARTQYEGSEDLQKQADFLLATCYRNLGNPDQEMIALRRCTSADPLWMPAREALAGALLRAGRVQDSLKEYSQINAQSETNAASLLNYARILFKKSREPDATKNDWLALRDVLDQLDQVPELAEDVTILRAELLVNEGNVNEAEALIEKLLESKPKSMALYQALIAIRSISKGSEKVDWEKVRMTLKQAGEVMGDAVALRLERAIFLLRRDGDSVDRQQLEQLASPREDWSEEDKFQLASGFAKYFLVLGDMELGKKYAEDVANSAIGKSNLPAHLLLFDIASQSEDEEAEAMMISALESVKKIEGTGPMWRVGEAIRLSLEARKLAESDPKQSEENYKTALEQLANAAATRPAWSRISRLRGDILDQQGKTDGAVEAYLEAIRDGEQSSQVISRVIYLLFDKGRYAEADEVIQRLQSQRIPFSSELTRVASEVSLQLENFDRALELSTDWAAESEKPQDHLWLAQVYGVSGNNEKALEEFRVAISKDPTLAASWIALIQFHVRTGKLDLAREVIDEAKSQILEEERDLTLAQAYQSIGDYPQASELYQKALEISPEDPVRIRRYAEFCLISSQPKEAEKHLNKLIEGEIKSNDADRVWARRSKALVVGMQGNDIAVGEARKLLKENATALGKAALEDQRVLAQILANRSDRDASLEAIGLLEAITKNAPKFSAADNFLLATLYKQIDNWTGYAQTMRNLLGNGGASNAIYVRHYAEALAEHKEFEESKLWFEKLKELVATPTANVAIDSQLLYRNGSYEQLEKLLRSSATTAEGRLVAAQLAEAITRQMVIEKKTDAIAPFAAMAEELFDKIAKEDPEQPLVKAAYYARMGRMANAIEEMQGKELPAQAFGKMIQDALQAPQLDESNAKLMIPVIQSMVDKHPDDLLLKNLLGDYCSWVGDAEQAKVAYQSVLKLDPNFIEALNNMAMILSATGKNLDEAKKAIDQAVELKGPTDYLLDTRAMVRFAMKNYQEAEADLRRAIRTQARPDRYFHLALVLSAQQKTVEAKQMLTKAIEGGVNKETLHPIEREAFDQLAGLK